MRLMSLFGDGHTGAFPGFNSLAGRKHCLYSLAFFRKVCL